MSKPRLRWLALLAGVLTALSVTATPASASTTPYVHGNQTVPVYSYANAVRESVWVQTGLDNDHDGVGDKVAVDLVRPREAAADRLKVPVVMEASPYYACCGRGNESELKGYDPSGTISKEPLYYDNYFVPRGYAFVAVDLPGTNRSTGCEDVGGREEVLGAEAVIDWLNGRAKAVHADGTPAVATTWTNGKVGMIGKSWDGSVANGVAATGVDGLKTIVPISSISSWYDYERFNGVLRSPSYPFFLNQAVTGRPDADCAAVLDSLNIDSDDATGNFNAFWASRDFRPDASKVRASVFVVHGINDTNVTTSQFALWWSRLRVPKKIWLSQMSHVDPFDIRRADWVDTLHRWFDFYLQGLPNGIDRAPRASLETAPGTWTDQPSWPAADARPVRVPLGDGVLNPRTPGGSTTWTDNPGLTEEQAVADPNATISGRVAFLSAPLTKPVRISGIPHATLRVRADRPTTELTARLVDYGTASRINYLGPGEGITTLGTQSCWGSSTPADDACYLDTAEDVVTSDHAVLTRGWQDAAHHVSLRFRTPLRPGTWYSIDVPMEATDQTVATGHVLGLILQQSDEDYSSPDPSGATVRLDLRGSSLTLPLTGRAGLPPAAAAPTVTTAPPAFAPRRPHGPLLP
ncbi:Xaa-Pro dipeptidyl-peptidase [Actinoplanes sp. NPDC051343]|uniref:Xaa-Pro dipeptidyl-peptidase n=1 Tax=Actinoplanes sp. NPDC051343 TaxID=3363906 RepID=UPI0037B3CDCB